MTLIFNEAYTHRKLKNATLSILSGFIGNQRDLDTGIKAKFQKGYVESAHIFFFQFHLLTGNKSSDTSNLQRIRTLSSYV